MSRCPRWGCGCRGAGSRTRRGSPCCTPVAVWISSAQLTFDLAFWEKSEINQSMKHFALLVMCSACFSALIIINIINKLFPKHKFSLVSKHLISTIYLFHIYTVSTQLIFDNISAPTSHVKKAVAPLCTWSTSDRYWLSSSYCLEKALQSSQRQH